MNKNLKVIKEIENEISIIRMELEKELNNISSSNVDELKKIINKYESKEQEKIRLKDNISSSLGSLVEENHPTTIFSWLYNLANKIKSIKKGKNK